MKTATTHATNPTGCRTAAILLGLTLAAGAFAGAAIAGDSSGDKVPAKMVRQIGVMEKILDKVMLDSPNFLVRVGDNTRGLYIPEFGIVFTCDASLTSGNMPDLSRIMSGLKDRFDIRTDKEGNETITIKKLDKERQKAERLKKKHGSSDEDTTGAVPPVPPSPPMPPVPDFASESAKESAQLYAAGKEELIQAMLDYGETLSALHAGQYVLIAAFMRDNDYFKENKISRLVLKAKIDDLRALGDGKLSDKDAKSRISIEEY